MASTTNQKAVITATSNQMTDMLNASEQEYVDALMARYDEFEKRLIADLRNIQIEAHGAGSASQGLFNQFQVDAQMEATIKSEILRLNGDFNDSLFDEMVSQYKDAYTASAWQLDQATPPEITPNMDIPPETYLREFLIQPWQSSMFSQRIGLINADMAHELQISVYDAMGSGQSAYDLGKTISGIIGTPEDGYRYRANMIARTELLRASNLAIQKCYEDNDDIIDDWIWVDTPGIRTCDDCDERGGKGYDEIAGEGDFQGQGLADEQELPVDAPIHPHCRCRWNAVVKSWAELLGNDMNSGNEKIQVKPYGTWADENLKPVDRGNL